MIKKSVKKELQPQELFIQKMLSELSQKISAPSSDLSSTRCLSRTVLSKHLIGIRDKLECSGYRRISAKDMLFHLEKAKVATPLNTIDPKTNTPQERFYLLGFSVNENNVDPIELLQALEPNGIICYFTALEYYGLTTQISSHHHIAKMVKGALNTSLKKVIEPQDSAVKKRTFDPLGSKRFFYESIPYYLTKRTKKTVPGVKERYLNERTRFHITTLEQTLIDTLHKPLSCGGASVVFEAWDNASGKAKGRNFLKYLTAIKNDTLTCRVGYMMQAMNYKSSDELSSFMSAAKKTAQNNQSEEVPSLLPGIDYQEIDTDWLIRVP